jgi:hypothetical protein
MPHRTVRSRVAIGAAAAAVAITTTVAAPASAAISWGTLSVLEGSKLQACKVSVRDGQAWKVKLRVNGEAAEIRTKGRAVAVHDGATTDRRWRSGWVAAGHTSAVGAVLVPRRAGWTLEFAHSGDELGSGGGTSPGSLRRC